MATETISTPEQRLKELGLELPGHTPAVGNYLDGVQVGELLFLSGHGPFDAGKAVFTGKLGAGVDVAEGQRAAEFVTLNVLATLKSLLGDLDRIEKVVRLTIFVNSDPDFTEQHLVANGASNLLTEVFGKERGSHARAAIGMASLPLGISVEIDGVFVVRPA